MKKALLYTLYILLFFCVMLLVAAYLFGFLYTTPSPYQRHINMDKQGEIVSDVFKVNKKCSYEINLILLHKEEIYNEYKNLLVGDKLPIKSYLKIDKLGGAEHETIVNATQSPSLIYLATNETTLGLDRVILTEGQYRIQYGALSIMNDLDDIDTVLAIQKTPKTTCPD
jgi:hypothetical protein